MLGQTVNVDLCFVPANHVSELKLPAVSGSSGRLVVERLADEGEVHDYPSRVFEDSELDYTQAMLAFAAASMNPSPEAPALVTMAEEAGQRPFSIQRQALRHEASQLCEQRRQTRAQRKQEDAKVPYGSPSGSWRSLRFRKLAGYTLVLATRRSGVALA